MKGTGCMDRSLGDFPHPQVWGGWPGWGWPTSPGENPLFPWQQHLPTPPHPHPPPASGELSALAPGFPSDETWLPACLPKPLAAHTLSSGEPQIPGALPEPLSLGSRPGTLALWRREASHGL